MNKEIELFLKKNNIKQIAVAESIIDNKNSILKNIKYDDYDKALNILEPVLFWGVYSSKDYNLLIKHNGPKFIFWGGNDANTIRLNKTYSFLTDVKIHICINTSVESNLLKYFNNVKLLKERKNNSNDFSSNGINIITYHSNFGLGQNGICLDNIFKGIDIKYNLIIIDPKKSLSQNLNIINNSINNSYLYNLFSFNYDQNYYINYSNINPNQINIALWAWELEVFPDHFLSYKIDEIWTISDFCLNVLNNHFCNKVINIKPPVIKNDFFNLNLNEYGKNLIETHNLHNKIVFSLFFDIKSSLERKNPKGILDLFKNKKVDSNKVLICKISNYDNSLEEYESSDNIIFIKDILNEQDLADIYKISDIYIQSSKSEGQGRSIMEALQCGTKVFCAEYSAMKEFYINNNITFIKHKLEIVNCEQYNNLLKSQNSNWANLCLDDLLHKINLINEKQEKNIELKEDIENMFSTEYSINVIKQRLKCLKFSYINNLVENKLEKKPNLHLYNLLNKDLVNCDEKTLSKHFNNNDFRNKYFSYETKDIKELLNTYNFQINYEPKYFEKDNNNEIYISTFNNAKRCILTTSNIKYISRVNLLVESILNNHGEIDIYNIIVDDYSEETKKMILEKNYNFTPIFLDELNISEIRDLEWFCYQYNVTDLNTAAKPFGFKYLFEKKGYHEILYFDSDIIVYSDLNNLFSNLSKNSFVLTPHFTEPLPHFDNANPTDNIVNRCGQFNLGFIGISNKKNGLKFVNYWCSKTLKYFTMDIEKGIFNDQSWCNLIPSFYSDYYIERSYCYNIAYWNLAHRDKTINKKNNIWYCKDDKLVFIHFSGININDKNMLSKHQNVLDINQMNIKELHNNYIDEIIKQDNLNKDVVSIKHKFDFYDDKSKILQVERDYVVNLPDDYFNGLIKKFKSPFSLEFKEYIKNLKTKKNLTLEQNHVYFKRHDLIYAFTNFDKYLNWFKNNRD